MPTTQSLIETILKNKSIVTYLESRGFHPVKRLSGGKLSYLCPLPDHKEKKPSFVVFTQSAYENYYCFGCGSGTTIIQLVAGLEGISQKQAIEMLSDGMEITEETENKLSDSRLQKNLLDESWIAGSLGFETLTALTWLSDCCRIYLESVENNIEECSIIDRFWEKVDKDIANYDFEGLKGLDNTILGCLQKRKEVFEKQKLLKRLKHDC